jgi:carbamoyltransferase
VKYILGISAFYHDSAAALLCDGVPVAAAQEERFTRIKHDAAFPIHAVNYCCQQAGIRIQDIGHVCFYDKPLLKFERLLETYLTHAPRGFASFRKAMPLWLKQKLHTPREIRKALGLAKDFPILFTHHHESHAASAFYPSPFQKAAILTCDGVGEWETTTWGVGEDHQITLLKALSFPHSLGLLYSAFTYFTGFKVNSGEYKLMGLAPYGNPVYTDLIKTHLIDLKPDGSFALNMDYFTYSHGLRMTGDAFARLFQGPPRTPESPLTQRERDMAASVQKVTEEVVLSMARHIHQETQMKHLVLAGGVALNCVANGRLLREGPFENIWIQPAAGDAGGALGAAWFVWHQLMQKPRVASTQDHQQGSLLGPAFSHAEICDQLDAAGAHYTVHADENTLLDTTASLLEQGQTVGWFQGRAEFGPRALGNRSILGDPRNTSMQSSMNVKIKFRESFRPFAPCVLAEHASTYFEMPPHQESPYMLTVAPVREQWHTPLSAEEQNILSTENDLCKRVNVVRSSFPAVTHVDYSARIQTVEPTRNTRFYKLLHAFHQKTGCPMLVNTSFNIRGEPIVHSPENAFTCFMATDMDALVIGNCVLKKEHQKTSLSETYKKQYLSQFTLD